MRQNSTPGGAVRLLTLHIAIFEDDDSSYLDDYFVEGEMDGLYASLFENEMDRRNPGMWPPHEGDATIEEIIHNINVAGHAMAYPEGTFLTFALFAFSISKLMQRKGIINANNKSKGCIYCWSHEGRKSRVVYVVLRPFIYWIKWVFSTNQFP